MEFVVGTNSRNSSRRSRDGGRAERPVVMIQTTCCHSRGGWCPRKKATCANAQSGRPRILQWCRRGTVRLRSCRTCCVIGDGEKDWWRQIIRRFEYPSPAGFLEPRVDQRGLPARGARVPRSGTGPAAT